MALTQEQVSQLYVALFGRASEGAGNKSWIDRGLNQVETANEMIASDAANDYFGGKLTNLDFVTFIYANTLGFTHDKEGIANWTAKLDAGISRGKLVVDMITAALSSEFEGSAPQNQLLNRIEVSNYMATNVEKVAPENVASTQFQSLDYPNGKLDVTHNKSTVFSAKSAIDKMSGGTVIDGETFTLTTGVDTFTGTDKNDTFNAAVLTANDGDVLAGGEGSDTLNLETASSITSNFKTSSIETVNLTALGAVTVDAKNLGGMTTLNSNDATGAVTVNNLAATTTIGVKGSATNNVDLKYTTGALNGSADKLTVNLNGSSATTVTAEAGFESVEVKTTAASTLTKLTASGATALTLSGNATLETADDSIDSFTDYTVTNTAKVTYNDIDTVKTFNASTNTGGIVGKDINATANLDNGTTKDVLTMSNTGSLIQTGSGNDNINVNSSALYSTSNAIIKLGAGNDTLALTAGTSGEYVYGEAGDDTIYLAAATTSADLIDGGEGTDTLNLLGNDLTYAMIAKGIEKVNVGGAAKDTTVNFVTIDSAVAITDATDDAVTFTNLLNGTTYTSNVAKDEALSLGFKTGQAATLNVDLTKGSTGAVTLTNVADATLTYGAASVMVGAITTDAANTKLTISATGALTGGQAIAASGLEKLETLTVTGNKDITLGNITNDAKLTSVTASSTGGAVTLGTVGDAANTEADVTVTKIEVASTTGDAKVGAIDFSGATNTVTGMISEITATAAGLAGADADIATTGGIVADKLGTVTATSTVGDAKIGDITVGADTAITAGIDGTVTALKASGLEAASIGAIKADSVGSIIVESTGTATAKDAKLSAITDGKATVSDGATAYSIAEIGTVTVTSAKGDAFFTNNGDTFSAQADKAADVAKLGNVVVTGADQAETESIIVRNSAGTAEMANLTITAGTGAAKVGDIIADTAGTITVKSTSSSVSVSKMTFADTSGVTVSIDAGTTIGATTDADTIKNTKGDLSVTLKAAGLISATGATMKFEAGAAASADIDIVVDASAVVGAVAATGDNMVVTNGATDAASSTIVKGGQAANFVTIATDAAAAGTVTYYGQTGADTITVTGKAAATIYGESGNDVIVGGAGNDTIYGGAGADTITGGAGVDTMTGGLDADTFVFATADIDTTAGAVTDRISDFSSAAGDKLSLGAAGDVNNYLEAGAAVANLATLLTAADTALDGTVKYYLGQVTGGASYLVIDTDGIGYTDVIELTGVTLATFAATDIIA